MGIDDLLIMISTFDVDTDLLIMLLTVDRDIDD